MTIPLARALLLTTGILLTIGQMAPSHAAPRDRFFWLTEINKASAVMVVERGIVPKQLGQRIHDAIVAVDAAGEPSYQIYGETIATVVHALAGRIDDAVGAAAGVFMSSNTLVGPDEREVSMRAREVALGLGRPVVFDPNLRLERWRSRAEAAAACNACVPGSLLVRANAREAEVMTGENDPERSALALLKAGAQMVVITLGPEGAILRGELRVDVPGRQAAMRSTIGAGDVLTGVLLARLATSGFYPAAVAASLPEAVAQSALACEHWGALE